MYKIKKISNKLILNLSISAPFLVGNQPEVYKICVVRSVSKRVPFTLYDFILLQSYGLVDFKIPINFLKAEF